MESDIGRRIRQRRRDLQMSMEELADAIGYNSESRKTSIFQIENGKNRVPIDRLPALAVTLKTSVLYLLGIIEDDQITDSEIALLLKERKNREDKVE